MISQLVSKDEGQIQYLNLRYIRVKWEDKQEISMIKQTIRIGTG